GAARRRSRATSGVQTARGLSPIARRSLRLLDQQGDLPRDDLSVDVTLDAHGDVPPRCWNNDLTEVAVRHDHMPEAATIELATLPREGQQRGVDQQLLEEIRTRVGCIGDPVALCGLDALSLAPRDIANLRPQVEDRLAERRVHLGRIVRQLSTTACAAIGCAP